MTWSTVLALYLQDGRGLGALASGLVFTLLAVAYLVASAEVMTLVARHGRRVVTLGAGLLVEGHLATLLAAVDVGVQGHVLWLAPGLLLVGAGMGLCLTALTATVLAGAVSGTLSTVQQVGGRRGRRRRHRLLRRPGRRVRARVHAEPGRARGSAQPARAGQARPAPPLLSVLVGSWSSGRRRSDEELPDGPPLRAVVAVDGSRATHEVSAARPGAGAHDEDGRADRSLHDRQDRVVTVVWRGDFPDPFLLRAHGRWYAYATQTRDVDLQVMTSPDLLSWTHLGNALAGLPRWAAPGHSWSPAVLPRPDGWVLYYATRLRGTGRQGLSVAVADRPEGPYADASDGPLVYQRSRGGSIDPDPFVDADGAAYLLWKSEDNALGGRTALWARRLRPDGLGFAGRAVKVLRQELAWQRPLVEAPCLVLHAGTYHLLYSAGWWESPGYGVGHATGPGATGPFTVSSRDGPWLSGRDGPGGQSVARGDDGRLHLAYHAWLDGRVGYAAGGVRALHVDRLDLTRAEPRLLPLGVSAD